MDLRQLSHHFSGRTADDIGGTVIRPPHLLSSPVLCDTCLRLVQGLANCAVAIEPQHCGREPPQPAAYCDFGGPEASAALGSGAGLSERLLR